MFLEGQLPGWLEEGPGKCCGRGSYKGHNCILGRLVVTSKHAYWQFLPDKLISPFFLPELLDNLPSVKARQKGPLPCSDLAVPTRPPADLQAWHLYHQASTLSQH